MSEDNMYTVTEQHFPPQRYHPTTNDESRMPVVLPVRGSETPQRKRPKYSRSKSGCMTCRVKKVKCDESKPVCMRCTHGARECSWPEGITTRRRTSSRKDSLDERPSTSESVPESLGLSESPPPSGREHTPPHYSLSDLVPVSHHASDSYETTYASSPGHNGCSIYPQQDSHSFPITSASHYMRYDHTYVSPVPQTMPCGMPATIRQQPLPHANPGPIYWNSELDTYYYNHRVTLRENMPAGQPASPHDHSQYRFFHPL